MDEDLKKGLKKMGKSAELKLTESLLRWKYRKEGKVIPDDENLGEQSKVIAEQAHKIIAKRGKSIWGELTKAYRKNRNRGESKD
ncbi:MAG: hypothetical protein JW896_00465 [Deltaproteobacteria bacterium]|nr:hypothetical protein [Deltaproteobacteria bacterium]